MKPYLISLAVGLLVAVGVGIYNAGVTAGMGTDPGVVAPYAGAPWGWGWVGGIFGLTLTSASSAELPNATLTLRVVTSPVARLSTPVEVRSFTSVTLLPNAGSL